VKRISWLLLFAVLACRQNAAAPESSRAPSPIRQTFSEVRIRPLVRVQVRLSGTGPASPAELKARKAVEEKIEQERIGTVVDERADTGFIDFTVQVDDTVTAIPRIRALLQSAGIAERSSVQVKSGR
jgi:hypothetical protein